MKLNTDTQALNLDPTFSVYRLVERVQAQSTQLNHRRTMSLISYEIENATLMDNAKGRIFSSFQRMSKFLPQIERYTRLAQKAEAVYVFGIPDVELPTIPNITYIPLSPQDQLSKEWFLVSHGLDYYSALATEELTDIDDADDNRLFQGLWTFDLDIVQILEGWLSRVVGISPMDYGETDYHVQKHLQLMSRSMQRLVTFTSKTPTLTDTQEIARGEIKSLVKDNLHPTLTQLAPDQHPVSTTVKDVVILFSDLRDFTGMSESMPPGELVEQVINPYLKIVSNAVYRHGGVIDKYLGDGVLAVFGLENSDGQEAENALSAASEVLGKLRQHYPGQLPIGIGIAGGQVHVGEIGSDHHREKTVIGDAVNMAQRLSQFGRNDIWLSEEVYAHLAAHDGIEEHRAVEIKGKAQPQRIYRKERV